MSATPQPGAPVTTESQQRGVIPQTTLAPTAFTVAALPLTFRVDLGGSHPKLNNAGAVVGSNGGAAVYRKGQVTLLNSYGTAFAINDSGDVIFSDPFGNSPKLYKGGKVSSILNQGGRALAINNNDVIVGTLPDPALNSANQGVYFSTTAPPKPIQSSPPGDTTPQYVTTSGEVAGNQRVGPPGTPYGAWFSPTQLLVCKGKLAAGKAQLMAINNANHFIVGYDGGWYFLCKGAQTIPPNGLPGVPLGLNDTDVIVGTEKTNGPYFPDTPLNRAYVRTYEGKYWDLNDLVPAGTPHLDGAVAVNNHDVILAYQLRYLVDPGCEACVWWFLLTPTNRWYGV
jgi:hypothetical protein